MNAMRVLLDNEPCAMTAGSVAEAIAGGAAAADRAGRLVVEVFVDGERWTERRIADPQAQSAGADEVRLVTADPRELVCDTFADAETALSEVDDLQNRAAELIQAGQSVEAMARLGEALSLWQAIHQAVTQGAGLLELDLETIEVDGEAVALLVQRLNEQLVAVRNALQSGDPIGLADTLMYEMPDVVTQWQSLFVQLQTVIRSRD